MNGVQMTQQAFCLMRRFVIFGFFSLGYSILAQAERNPERLFLNYHSNVYHAQDNSVIIARAEKQGRILKVLELNEHGGSSQDLYNEVYSYDLRDVRRDFNLPLEFLHRWDDVVLVDENTAKIIELSPRGTQTRFRFTLPCLLYTSPSPRDKRQSRMPSSA